MPFLSCLDLHPSWMSRGLQGTKRVLASRSAEPDAIAAQGVAPTPLTPVPNVSWMVLAVFMTLLCVGMGFLVLIVLGFGGII